MQLIHINENFCNVDYHDRQIRTSHGHTKFVLMTDRTSVQTGATSPPAGSYMVQNFGTSVRTEIPHEVHLRG
jgi:hypothetical protein